MEEMSSFQGPKANLRIASLTNITLYVVNLMRQTKSFCRE